MLALSDAPYDVVKDYVLRNCVRFGGPSDVDRVLFSFDYYALMLQSWRLDAPALWVPPHRMYEVTAEAHFIVRGQECLTTEVAQTILAKVNGRFISWSVQETTVTLKFAIYNYGRDAFRLAGEWNLPRFQEPGPDYIPMLPSIVSRQFETRLCALGVTDIRWRPFRTTKVSDAGKKRHLVLVGGEGVWSGDDFNACHEQLYLSGSEVPGCWFCWAGPWTHGRQPVGVQLHPSYIETMKESQERFAQARSILVCIIDCGNCDRYTSVGMGSGLTPKFIGCHIYRKHEPDQWCLACEATALFARMR